VSKQRAERLINPGSIPEKAEHYVLFPVSSLGMGPTQSLIEEVLWVLPLRVKQSECEPENLPPSNADYCCIQDYVYFRM